MMNIPVNKPAPQLERSGIVESSGSDVLKVERIELSEADVIALTAPVAGINAGGASAVPETESA